MRRTRGFTLIELLVVIAIIALLIGLLLPALAKAQKNARSLKDLAQVKEIHQAMLIFANDSSSGRLPLPGLINRGLDPHTGLQLPGQGPEDVFVNHSGPLYSALIAQEFFNGDLLIGPSEISPVVKEYSEYDYSFYDPTSDGDSYWDPGFVTELDAGICNTSFAHMALCGKRKDIKWRNTQNPGDPVVGTRGVRDGATSGDEYKRSPTLQLHGPDKAWVGNVCFNDNHAETINNFYPKLTSYEPATTDGSPTKDNIFEAEFLDYGATGQASNDAYLVISTTSTDDTVTAEYDELN